MKIVWATEDPPDSFSSAIFLAGPTPRSNTVQSWRPKCLQILKRNGYQGVVFVPEPKNGERYADYDRQVSWEEMGLRMADQILFWIPRQLESMPAFTTNVEWGMWFDSGKAVFGAPPQAPKNTYLRHYADKFGLPVCETLEETVGATLECIGEGAMRRGGEREVPLFIWNREEFQDWYRTRKSVGHRLDGAELLWHFPADPGRPLFCWVLRVKVFIPEEDRHKSGEFMISRLDTSSVVAFQKVAEKLETKIVLVKEFRSSASQGDGYVWELPGGSTSRTGVLPLETAFCELEEETGVSIPVDRFEFFATRQSFATLLSHKAHLFQVRLDEEEMAAFESQVGKVHGESDSERCIVQVLTLKEILSHPSIDWAQMGMILSVLTSED